MKTSILLFALFCTLIYEAKPTFKLYPFHLSFAAPITALGWVLLIAGVVVLTSEMHKRSYQQGVEQALREERKLDHHLTSGNKLNRN